MNREDIQRSNEIDNCESCGKRFGNDENRKDDLKHLGSLSGKVLCGVCFRNWKSDFEFGAEFEAENGRNLDDKEI